MADLTAARAHPLAPFAPTTLNHGRVTLTPGAPRLRLLLQGPVADAASAALGFTLPIQPMQSIDTGARAALWLGPNEWLLLAREDDPIQTHLAQSLATIPHALVDISHRNAAIDITGPGAALALNGAVPLDLGPKAFPTGMCSRTIFEKTGITLWRRNTEHWHLETGRSFIPYVWNLLTKIAAGDGDVG